MKAPPFKTKDLYLGAALLYMGYELVDTDRTDPKKIQFIFDIPLDQAGNLIPIIDVANAYISKQVRVEPNEYQSSLKSLRSLVYGLQ